MSQTTPINENKKTSTGKEDDSEIWRHIINKYTEMYFVYVKIDNIDDWLLTVPDHSFNSPQ